MQEGLEYNTQKSELVFPEYGRNVQLLVDQALVIENLDQRKAYIEKVIDLIQQMYPQNRNVEDYREKLWHHVYRIADYKLEVLPPSGEVPKPEEAFKKPDSLVYPPIYAQFRHYGHNVVRLMQKALSMEDGPRRDEFFIVIAAYMKLAYKTWNKEHYVTDEIIKEDFYAMTNSTYKIPDDLDLDDFATSKQKKAGKGNFYTSSSGVSGNNFNKSKQSGSSNFRQGNNASIQNGPNRPNSGNNRPGFKGSNKR